MWGLSFAQMGKGKVYLFKAETRGTLDHFPNAYITTGDDQQASEATTHHIDFDDLYNDSFVPYRRSLVWVENGTWIIAI